MVDDEVEDTGCANVQVAVSVQGLLHVLLIQFPVYLSSGTLMEASVAAVADFTKAWLTHTAGPFE